MVVGILWFFGIFKLKEILVVIYVDEKCSDLEVSSFGEVDRSRFVGKYRYFSVWRFFILVLLKVMNFGVVFVLLCWEMCVRVGERFSVEDLVFYIR